MSEDVTNDAGTSETDPVESLMTQLQDSAIVDKLREKNLHVLSGKAFSGIKAEAALPEKKRAEALQAQYEELQAQHEAATAELKKLQREAMTEAERRAADRADAEAKEAEGRRRMTELEAGKRAAEEALASARLDNALSGLFGDAHSLQRAITIAKTEIDGLTFADGAIKLSLNGADLVGQDAIEAVKAWWEAPEQASLRRARQAGPPTNGGNGQPATTGYQPLDPRRHTLQERIKYAREQQGKTW